MEQLLDARRQAIQGVAAQHDVERLHWWPPTAATTCFDFLVEGVPSCLPTLRTDLERALGSRVAIYLADQLPVDAWQRIAPQTVAV